MRSPRCIVTITFGNEYVEMSKITHPIMESYSNRVGADFIVWNTPFPHEHPFFKKMDIKQLLSVYEQVLFIDTDVVITPRARDIFQMMPDGYSLGLYEEGHLATNGPNDKSRHLKSWVETYKMYCENKGLVLDDHLSLNDDWNNLYYNSGVMLCRPNSFDIFELPIPEQLIDGFFPEQDFLNFLIYYYKINIFNLSFEFNRFPYWQEKDSKQDRILSDFIHYAGVPDRLNMMLTDIERM